MGRKIRKQRKVTLATVSQSLFLTVKFFMQNRLLSYAGACSFSFLFSVIPVFMLIVVVLVGILHASPEMIKSLVSMVPDLSGFLFTDDAVKAFESMRTSVGFAVLIAAFIFWMARRFFASVFDSFQNVFHTQARRRVLISQMFTLALEAAIVVVVAVLCFAYFSFRAVVDSPQITGFLRRIPQLDSFFSAVVLQSAIGHFPNILIFIVLAVIYKTVPGTRPQKRVCLLASFLCTFSFFVFRSVMHLFLNVSNYNLIYGVLGQVIISLMDIYFFFVFFLFFAQYIFVYQFFDQLLLGELYLLPRREDAGFLGAAKLLLFIRADFLLAEDAKVLSLARGETVYAPGEDSDGAYYIAEGSVAEIRGEEVQTLSRGDFFGEIGCVIRKRRNSLATASSDSRIVKIPPSDFSLMVKKNPQAMNRLLAKISENLESE